MCILRIELRSSSLVASAYDTHLESSPVLKVYMYIFPQDTCREYAFNNSNSNMSVLLSLGLYLIRRSCLSLLNLAATWNMISLVRSSLITSSAQLSICLMITKELEGKYAGGSHHILFCQPFWLVISG